MEPIVSGVGVIDKSFRLIAALEVAPKSLNELATVSGVNRATAHRLATALVEHGVVRRLEDGRFALGFRLIELGGRVTSGLPLAGTAQPILELLRDTTKESAQLYIRDGDDRICVAHAESAHGLRTIVPIGRRLSMARGSAASVLRLVDAKAVAADLAQGYAESVGEREAGVASVSAPVLDPEGMVAAAVSVSGPIGRTSEHPGERYGAAVVAAARSIEESMGWG